MKFSLRHLLFATLATLAIGAVAQTTDDPFAEIDISGSTPTKFVPRGLDTTPVTVVVLLAGEPVAVSQKNALGLLTRAQKDAIIGGKIKCAQHRLLRYHSVDGSDPGWGRSSSTG